MIALALIGFAVIGYFFVGDLWGAFTEGVVHAKGYPFYRAENPALFWIAVVINCAVLLVALGFVIWSAAVLGT